MLTDRQLREGGPPDTYDNTILSMFPSCPRKLYWFLRGADYHSIPVYFTFGKAWQVFLVEWYSKSLKGLSPEEIYHHGEAAKKAGQIEWQKDSPIEATSNTLDNFNLLANWYMIEYPSEHWEPLNMEIGFAWPIEGTPWFLAGSMDGTINWPPYGKLILENKTTGMYLSDSFVRQYTFSPQITQYIWGLTKYEGEEIFGCLMNIASKRVPKKKPASGLFTRTLERRSAYQLEEYERDSRLVIEDIHREWDRWTWPKGRDPLNCAGGIGKSPCLFQGLCLSEAPPEDINPLDFPEIADRQGPWEPWKRKG